MSDYVLLLDRQICPACRVRRAHTHSGPCHNCGVPLFPQGCPDNPQKYEDETGIRYWWAFHRLDGWKARDHYMVPAAKPNSRVYKIPKLPKDYGRQITPAGVVGRSAKSKRVRLKESVNLPQRRFHKVY